MICCKKSDALRGISVYSFYYLGFRHIKLRNECYQPLGLPTLFVEIVTKDYVPEGLTGNILKILFEY